ncbi:MAG TPA: aldehyde dehydrogenase [Rhizobiales bacterium]|nr:acetolactate synthase isozyme 1 large subunit [bacterium BMS3Bbin10]HDO52169.1 aldehyde dehydrogenase [Hyphomicrobiales bacterium]
MTAPEDSKLKRREVLAGILAARGDALAVSSLGTSTYDLFAVSPAPENAYLWNAMGLTASVGLGLAIAQPDRRILVIAGDGDVMMGIGSLSVIAAQAPENLSILVIDNEGFEETGGQAGLSAFRADIAEIARGSGFRETMVARDEKDAARLADFLWRRTGPVLAVAKVGASSDGPVYPCMDGPELVRIFRAAVLGDASP